MASSTTDTSAHLDHNSDLDTDDEFLVGDDDDDDDNLSLDGIYDVTDEPPPYYPGITVCIVCERRPPYSRGGKSYPTCGLTCAGILENARNSANAPSITGSSPGPSNFRSGPYRGRGAAPSNQSNSYYQPQPSVSADPNISHLAQHLGGYSTRGGGHTTRGGNTGRRPRNLTNLHNLQSNGPPPPPMVKCVVCLVKPCRDSKYVTCGLTCAEKLCKGGGNPNNCDYCHRRPKLAGYNQCGDTCRDSAKLACLLCKSRPKYKRYHLCGKTCKQIAIKSTPLILEAPAGHATYDMVEKKFQSAWKYPGHACPKIKKIYKIIESKTFLQPYDRYKRSVGSEVFRYHGTTRKCTLGSPGNTQLCTNTSCPLCSILRTSFKTSLASPSGAFGPGIYSSSASNKAYSYTNSGNGAMLLTKVVLGKVRQVNGWNEVMSCPAGFNSVVFDRQGGALNETIVYTDDAIRPVFLIIF
ncbi:hypothetical protein GALMADRAFT_245586 [Galerina marginata CBS 339.88]|uniref:PARP catalytic domain-containing protein n=1 Tax=Galerina marginata (strain CBS 339.88) TaxID=685588 RepID=A0A067T5G5_GALM3|nr:hypothetical protein GALMADRAFT_245586 [Galerina marginata CBS 339.88]